MKNKLDQVFKNLFLLEFWLYGRLSSSVAKLDGASDTKEMKSISQSAFKL